MLYYAHVEMERWYYAVRFTRMELDHGFRYGHIR